MFIGFIGSQIRCSHVFPLITPMRESLKDGYMLVYDNPYYPYDQTTCGFNDSAQMVVGVQKMLGYWDKIQ